MNTIFYQAILIITLLPFSASNAITQANEKIPIAFVDETSLIKLSNELTYPARVVPEIQAKILSESDGMVSSINLYLGQKVNKGALLITVKNMDPAYKYAPVKILSPISGIISSIEVNEGSIVQKGARLVTVVNPKKVKVMIEISGKDLSLLSPGATGVFTIPGQKGSVPIKITGISPLVDPSTGTASCELKVIGSPSEVGVHSGQTGKASFKVNAHEGIEVPESAIAYRGEKPFLRVIENEKVKFIEVLLGDLRRGKVEILKGIEAHKTYVVRASTFIADGETVRVENLEALKAEKATDASPGTESSYR